MPASSTSPQTSAVSTTTVTTTVTTTGAAGGAGGFDPPCAESTSNRSHYTFADETALDAFGPLAAAPALRLTLPRGRSQQLPGPQSPMVSAARIPGGVLLAIGAPDASVSEGSILAAVDADGGLRWVRCPSDQIHQMFVAPAASSPTKALIAYGIARKDAPPLTDWRIVSLDNGSVVGELKGLFAATGVDPAVPIDDFPVAESHGSVVFGPASYAVIDPARDRLLRLDLTTWTVEVLPVPELTAGAAVFPRQFAFTDSGELALMDSGALPAVVSVYHAGQWTQDPAVIRRAFGTRAAFDGTGRTLVGVDALGQQVWRDDVSPIAGEGFRSASSGPVTVVSGCFAALDASQCMPPSSLAGVETDTGKVLWQIPGWHQVSVVGDGFALISAPTTIKSDGNPEPGTWMLIDTSNGQVVDPSQHWTDPDTFLTECCGGGAYIWVGHDGGVVTAVNGEHVAIWYPKAAALTTSELTIP